MEPDYPPCSMRLLGTIKGVAAHAKCNDASKDHYHRLVTPIDCRRCQGLEPEKPSATDASPEPPAVPEPPGLVRRAISYTEALARWTAAGRPGAPGQGSRADIPPALQDVQMVRPRASKSAVAAAAGSPITATPCSTRSRWPRKTVPETCGETDALRLPRRSTSPDARGGCNYLVYSGGPMESFIAWWSTPSRTWKWPTGGRRSTRTAHWNSPAPRP